VTTTATAAELVARLERVPFSRWHRRPRILMGSATFFDAFDALSLAFVLPVLVQRWSITPSQVGWLIAVGYIGQFAGALIFGAVAERIGRVRSAAGATALMSVMSIACAFTGGFPSLIVLRLLQGIGVGGEMPVAAVYINELSKAQGRGRFFLLYELIFPIGLMMTGQIGALVVPAFGWQIMFLVGGIPGLMISLLLLRLPESPRWLIAKGRLEEADRIVADIESALGEAAAEKRSRPPRVAAPAVTRDTSMAAAAPARWQELTSRIYRRRTVVIWILWAAAYFITNGLNNWMPTLYNRVYQLPLNQALRAASLTNVAQVALLLVCAFVIDRSGRRAWTIAAFGAGALLLLPLGLYAAHSVVAVIALVTIAYGVVGSVNAVLYLYTPEIYPTRMRAIGTGAATCWLRLASAAGPLLVGYLVAESGTASVFLMFASAGVLGAVAGTAMLETQNRRLEDIAS